MKSNKQIKQEKKFLKSLLKDWEALTQHHSIEVECTRQTYSHCTFEGDGCHLHTYKSEPKQFTVSIKPL